MHVAILGYGAVAAIHARQLLGHATVLSIFGPDATKAQAFAHEHAIPRAHTTLGAALDGCEVAVICSPSPLHYQQALEALQRGLNTLVELPACSSSKEASDLDALAEKCGLTLQCAHTSRYIEAYGRIAEWVRGGELGDIQQVRYIRSVPPRSRSWTDDALLHHAEHPLDLFLAWFGAIKPIGCVANPGVPGAQDVCLLGSVYGNVPMSISISYTCRLREVKMTLAGSKHSVATDGFSYIASDHPAFTWSGNEQQTYETAIRDQDVDFLDACRTGRGGVPWKETQRLTDCVSEFENLWNRR